MRLLFDLGHPAHVHLFRNLIARIQKDRGEALAAARDKDVTVSLCEAYQIPHVVLSKAYSGNVFSGATELIVRTWKLLVLALKFKPDALLGTSFSIGIVGKLIRRPSFVFEEDDASVIPLFSSFVYPTCTYIVTPDCLRYENYGKKHLTYPGYHELAYLHPDHFTPDPEVPRSIGLDIEKPYFILRLVSLKAHHDTHEKGLSIEATTKLVDLLSAKGRVLITSEGELRDQFKKYQFSLPAEKLLDTLAFSSMCIGDSQTVTAEAAVLGVPSLRCNTFVGRISYLEELENKYGLTRGFTPDKSDELLDTIQIWLSDINELTKKIKIRREKMLNDCVNVAGWQWQMLRDHLPSQ